MPLTADRHTPYTEGRILALPVAAGAVIHMGAQLAANADGYVVPGSEDTDLTYLGRADEAVDNSDGGDGDKQVHVRRGVAFHWANSSADPVTQASLGKHAYIEDDETVAGTDGDSGSGATRSQAGIVVGLDDAGVWIE